MIKSIQVLLFMMVTQDVAVACANRNNLDCEKHYPTEEQCKQLGGFLNKNGECEKKVSKKECDLLGGIFDPEIGCYQEPTDEECKILGKTKRANGFCKGTQ